MTDYDDLWQNQIKSASTIILLLDQSRKQKLHFSYCSLI